MMDSSTKNHHLIQTGPAGRAIAEPMPKELVEAFNLHLTMERNSSAQYFANSLWFLERELKGFSTFFSKEADSEQSHANQFAKYLIARGQTVVLEELPSPEQTWNSIEHLISASFQMEADVTTSLHQLYAISERCSDMRSTVFLDPTIDNQVSSEDEFAYILGQVKFSRNESSAILLIDKNLMEL